MPDSLIPTPCLRGQFVPASADPEARTVTATVSTGAAVRRRDETGPFWEVLSLDGTDPAQMVGAPVLDSHKLDSLERVLGVVVAAGRDGDGLWASIRFSERPAADAVFRDVLAGILRGLSVGYAVQQWLVTRGADGVPVRTATAWTIAEVSFVPIPADPAAVTRNGENMTNRTRKKAVHDGAVMILLGGGESGY